MNRRVEGRTALSCRATLIRKLRSHPETPPNPSKPHIPRTPPNPSEPPQALKGSRALVVPLKRRARTRSRSLTLALGHSHSFSVTRTRSRSLALALGH
eukprot:9499022-Pyramimonas_sp.AAC.2